MHWLLSNYSKSSGQFQMRVLHILRMWVLHQEDDFRFQVMICKTLNNDKCQVRQFRISSLVTVTHFTVPLYIRKHSFVFVYVLHTYHNFQYISIDNLLITKPRVQWVVTPSWERHKWGVACGWFLLFIAQPKMAETICQHQNELQAHKSSSVRSFPFTSHWNKPSLFITGVKGDLDFFVMRGTQKECQCRIPFKCCYCYFLYQKLYTRTHTRANVKRSMQRETNNTNTRFHSHKQQLKHDYFCGCKEEEIQLIVYILLLSILMYRIWPVFNRLP